MEATAIGADTALAKIIALVDEATSSKAPIAKLADKVSGYFVPAVIGIAVLAAVVWLVLGASWHFALTIAISVLVISCPCAWDCNTDSDYGRNGAWCQERHSD